MRPTLSSGRPSPRPKAEDNLVEGLRGLRSFFTVLRLLTFVAIVFGLIMVGLYRDRWKDPMTLYVDNYTLGDSFAAVDPSAFDRRP